MKKILNEKVNECQCRHKDNCKMCNEGAEVSLLGQTDSDGMEKAIFENINGKMICWFNSEWFKESE